MAKWTIHDEIDRSSDPLDMGMDLPEGFLTLEDEELLREHSEGKDLAIELGTYKGRGAILLSHFAKRVVTIDNGSLLGREAPEAGAFDSKPNIQHLIMNTAAAAPLLKDGEADLLFIDAGHTYDSVIEDWNLYAPKIKDDAVIIFHDYKYMKGENGSILQVKPAVDFLVANEPLQIVEKKGWCLVAKKTRLSIVRKDRDVSFYEMPLKELIGKTLFLDGNCIRHDVIVRFMAVEHYRNTGKILPMYEKLQMKRMETLAKGRDVRYDTERLPRLVESFGEIGFNRGTPIIIGLNEQIIEGAHRLACCMSFGIEIIPMEKWSDKNGSREDGKWFPRNFTKEENDVIARKEEEVKARFCGPAEGDGDASIPSEL